ncbi:MAG: cysteine--tRNA ligase [Anaerolineaceae bacterium]|nr:cysteine--tRNA ligase [Anaerolineaceae bacterium]
MSIRIYNTISRQKEELETLEPNVVKMYVCGPTVYDKAHIGHAMSSLVFDIIRRYLEYKGYEVQHAMNFTDVDDKIINRANKMGVDPFELAHRYIEDYERHLEDLNIKIPTLKPKATEEIDQIISMIEGLIEKEYAYPIDGDVYFRVLKDEDYGRLSGRKIEDMQSGSRIEVDQRKESAMDFALWKSARPDEPSWESPWGPGRPGWHIECSAMNLHHLGEQIDIHGGGNDLIFPHHENEIAQSESLTGKPFARYWVHNGMLQLKGEKMSKSLGNLISIEEFLSEHSSDVFRIMVLNADYRGPLTFTDDVIVQAENALVRLNGALRPALPGAAGAPQDVLETLKEKTEATLVGFEKSMDDDFNSAGALGIIFDLVRGINQARSKGASDEDLSGAQSTIRKLTGILGLRLDSEAKTENPAGPFIDLLIKLRKEVRSQKNFAMSDKIRDELIELGVILEDSKDGTSWRWK